MPENNLQLFLAILRLLVCVLLKILLLIAIFIKNLAEKEKEKLVKTSFSPPNHSSFTESLKCLEENE